MGVNLKEEAQSFQAQIGGGEEEETGVQSAFQDFGVRAFQVTNERMLHKTVAELEAMPRDARVFISRIRHKGHIIEPEPDTIIHEGDVIAVATRTELLMARGIKIGAKWMTRNSSIFPRSPSTW